MTVMYILRTSSFVRDQMGVVGIDVKNDCIDNYGSLPIDVHSGKESTQPRHELHRRWQAG